MPTSRAGSSAMSKASSNQPAIAHLPRLQQFVEHIFDARYLAQQESRPEVTEQSFAHWVVAILGARCSTESLMRQQAREFTAACHRNSALSSQIDLMRRCISGEMDEEEASFLMWARDHLCHQEQVLTQNFTIDVEGKKENFTRYAIPAASVGPLLGDIAPELAEDTLAAMSKKGSSTDAERICSLDASQQDMYVLLNSLMGAYSARKMSGPKAVEVYRGDDVYCWPRPGTEEETRWDFTGIPSKRTKRDKSIKVVKQEVVEEESEDEPEDDLGLNFSISKPQAPPHWAPKADKPWAPRGEFKPKAPKQFRDLLSQDAKKKAGKSNTDGMEIWMK